MALKSHVKNKTHERLVHRDQIKNFFFLKKNKANTETLMEKAKISRQIAAKMCFRINFLVHIFKANSIHFSRWK